jgi:hypothetical protein
MNRHSVIINILICIIIIFFSGLVFSQEPKGKPQSPEDMNLDDVINRTT